MAAFTSKATGNWDSEGATTWNEAGHPTAGDTVTVQNGHVVTLDSATSCTDLTINSGGTVTDATNNQGLTVSNDTFVEGTLTCGSANMSFGSGREDDTALDLENGSVFTGGSGNHVIGSMRIDTCTCTLTSGTTTINGYNDFAGNFYGIVLISVTFDANGGEVIFNHATDTQEIWVASHAAYSFHDLTVNKAAGNLQFGENSGFPLTITGDLTITSGTFALWDGTDSADITLTVTGTTSITSTFDGKAATTTTFSGDVTINGGGVLTASSLTTNFGGGTWTNNGTFTHSSGLVNFTGGNQAIVKSNTWYSFSKTWAVASQPTLTVDNTSTQTFEKNVTLEAASAISRIHIESDSAGNAFNFTMTADAVKTSLDFLAIKDSDASGSNAIHKPIAPGNSTDVSGNTDWFAASVQPTQQIIIIS